MSELHSLVFTKKISGATFDSAVHGIVCLEDMPIMSFEAKDIAENDWPDESGLEVYDKGDLSLKMKPQDMTFQMGAKGDSCLRQYTDFLNFLTTGGVVMSVSSEFTGMSIPAARFVKAEPGEYCGVGPEKYILFKLTIKVTGY